jgi:hypothetical protein
VSIPIVAPEISIPVGMIYPKRDPMPPLTAALINEARQLIPALTELA